jgi:hypothetical protein
MSPEFQTPANQWITLDNLDHKSLSHAGIAPYAGSPSADRNSSVSAYSVSDVTSRSRNSKT